MGARVKLPEGLSGLSRTQLKKAIKEAFLYKEDALIATRYFVERFPQIEIAEELKCRRATISARLPRIKKEVCKAAEKLYKNAEN